MVKILLTGAYGSGCSYLVDFLKKNVDAELHGMVRWDTKQPVDFIVHECDLNDCSSVIRTLQKCEPDYIMHMAANAHVYSSFGQPSAVMNNNINSTLNLYEGIRLLKLDPKIVLCSTSETYGDVPPEDVPIKETQPLQPTNPYSVSKLTQEKIALCYYSCYNIKTIITRAFTYINPKRKDLFSSNFARQIVLIEKGKQDRLYHGNLYSTRSIIDVRDIVEAYWLASQRCEYGEAYNIGGENIIEVGQLLNLLIKKAKVPIKTELDPNLLRPKDVTSQVPDTTKFYNKTGWKPKISLDESLEFLLEHYRHQL